MLEGALTSLMNNILTGAALTSAGKSTNKKEAPKVIESEEDKPREEKAEIRKLTKDELDELEYLLLAGGLDTKQVKSVLSGDVVPRKWFKDFDRDILKQIASITGEKYYENIVYGDGGKLGKGYTTIPLSKRVEPKTETMPLGESEGKKGTTIEGEEAKNKDTVMKGEEAKSKGTVMEIPEEDLSRLIKMVANYDLEKKLKDPDFMSLVDRLAIKNKVHRRDVLTQLTNAWNAEHQKVLDKDMEKHDAGRIDYEKKLKNPKLKEATDKAAEKYKEETPDYKYDDVKRNKEAKGEKYTGERYAGKPSEEALRKADDFVTKNAGRDYEARLDRAQNKTSIYRTGK